MNNKYQELGQKQLVREEQLGSTLSRSVGVARASCDPRSGRLGSHCLLLYHTGDRAWHSLPKVEGPGKVARLCAGVEKECREDTRGRTTGRM